MSVRLHNWFLHVAKFGKLLAIVIALASQISAGALAVPRQSPESPRALLDAAMVLCLGGNHPGKDRLPPIHHHLPDPGLAAIGHQFVQQAAVLDDGMVLAPPPAGRAFWTALPKAQGPPARYAAAFYPTGPPSHLI